jgi:hypothetical protein
MEKVRSADPVGPPATGVPSWGYFAPRWRCRCAWLGNIAAEAFDQATLAVTAVVTDTGAVRLTHGWVTKSRAVAEEAPGAYKDVALVVDAVQADGLAKKVLSGANDLH